MDVHTRAQRRRNMQAIRSRDTKPEMLVRRLAHGLGYRYRLHARNLPGRPDLVFVSRRKVIFIHGCFWHVHDCPYGRVVPKTNAEFWQAKRTGNIQRDRAAIDNLRAAGWEALTIWECETRDLVAVKERLQSFLDPPSGHRKKSKRSRRPKSGQ